MAKTNKIAYLFPGQASQKPGMGKDLYLNSVAAREAIKEIDRSLGRSLVDVMFYGSELELTTTSNAQPAIAAVSIAAWKALEEARSFMQMPAMVAGHSLGEYSLLAVSGVLTTADTMRLIAKRSELMQRACETHQGGMVAIIGLDEKTVYQICRATDVYLSNVNTPSQIIISGESQNLSQAIDLASARGARRAVPLAVGGAFHSKYMAPAQAELNEFIDTLEFNDPLVPIVGNVDAEPIYSADAAKDELKKQLQSCVRWSDSIQRMVDMGVDSFIEIGPGNFLTGMVKRIAPKADVLSVSDYGAVQDYIERF